MAPVAQTSWGLTRIPKLGSSVILSPPCFRAGEPAAAGLQLSFALSIQRQTAGMLLPQSGISMTDPKVVSGQVCRSPSSIPGFPTFCLLPAFSFLTRV